MSIHQLRAAMRDAASKGTPGRYSVKRFDDAQTMVRGPEYDGGKSELIAGTTGDLMHENAAHIALANPVNVLRLLDALDKAEALLRAVPDLCGTVECRKATEAEHEEWGAKCDEFLREGGA